MTPEPDWVDLGLPSGLLWAKMNVGASAPAEAGLYFSWGNSPGHPWGDGYEFSQAAYDESPGADIEGNITLAEDMARLTMGAPWRLPTRAEFKELVDNCTSVWTTFNGVGGRLFTSNINGKTLFLPSDGFWAGSSISGAGSNGYYWSSSHFSQSEAYYMNFDFSTVNTQSNINRRYGFTVRAVATP